MTRLPLFAQNRLLDVCILLFMAAPFAAAQNDPAEHVFQVSRAQLDKALQDLNASSPGKLPVLEGFVASDVRALEKYQRAYYQYKLEFHPVGSSAISLRVSAKVTAWYAGDTASQAGYRLLPSNGRLETDLLERLQEALQQKSPAVARARESKPSQNSADRPSRGASAPSAPAESTGFHTPFPLEQPATRADMVPPDGRELAQEKRVQQLNEQAANLEEVLHNQARPADLAAVRRMGTPVFAKPIELGDVLFRADAEDEFKVLDESAGWVHVQVSGISRGWIRRTDLEMPGEVAAAAEAGIKQPPATSPPELHEETSLFPGEWSALRGRMVRITWVRPEPGTADRWPLARSVFRDTYSRISQSNAKIEGAVIVIDDADGAMIAATSNSLRRWNTGAISDAAFRKECWADPPEALGETSQRDVGAKSRNQ